jgi:transcriptional regulator with XRE-family HTH domain
LHRGVTQHGSELGDFLRSRRESLSPADVGLPPGGRRRTPGLRREEVALLAGVSISWYTWLEQGRPIRASAQVLDAIARTLHLDTTAKAHLHALAAGRVEVETVDVVPDALARLVDAFDPAPAYVLGPRWEILAWNDAQARLFPFANGTNLLALVATDPAVRRLIVDWSDELRRMVAQFRADMARRAGDAVVAALVDDLRSQSPEFTAAWEERSVESFTTRLRRFDHPLAGRLTFEYQQLTSAEWPSLRVAVQLPIDGDDSVERLAAWRNFPT